MNEEYMKVKKLRDLDEACSELERELNVRARCFPRWIAEGKVNRIDGQDRLDRLASALAFLEREEVAALLTNKELDKGEKKV